MSVTPRELILGRVTGQESAIVVPLFPVMWTVTLLAALGLRFAAIDAVPLSPGEAARALEARSIWRGEAVEYASGPILSNLLALWFGLFTAADGPARAVSALAGWGLCLTPLLFRPWIGRAGAFGAAVLLAISPTGVLTSRSADPASLVALSTTLLVGSLLLALRESSGRWLLLAGASVAIGLGSSPAFVGQLMAVTLALALVPPLGLKASLSLRVWLPRALALGLLVALLLDTLFLTRPPGLQAGLIDPFTSWLSSLGVNRRNWLSAGLFLMHEAVLLGLAIWALPGAVRSPMGRFLLAWLVASIVVGVVGRSLELASVGTMVVPLALLAGLGLSAPRWDWVSRTPRAGILIAALSVVAPLGFVALATNLSVQRGTAPPQSTAIIGVAGLVALFLVASAWLNRAEIGTALGLAALLVLAGLGVSFLTGLNYRGFERGGYLLFGQSTRPEIRRVEEMARDWWRQDPAAPVQVDRSLRPLLEWSLRDGPPVEWISRAPATPDRAILGGETAAGRGDGAWLRLPIAERYDTRDSGIEPLAFWRWLVTRERFVQTESYAILFDH